ncbi:MAG: hypothetical protein H6732_14595 [Alphaproteobacteria bacterium]|nr:hypothetical protein [Alphaproteobacteria bacterium]
MQPKRTLHLLAATAVLGCGTPPADTALRDLADAPVDEVVDPEDPAVPEDELPVPDEPEVADPTFTVGDPIGTAPGLRAALPVEGLRSRAGTVVLSPDDAVAYVADADNGAVHRVVLADSTTSTLPLGAEPTRLVRAGSDLWVTLRGTGEVVRLHDDGTALAETDRVHVGAEPYGLALSTVQPWIFVALSQEDAVLALDLQTLEPIGRWVVPGEPRWLSVNPVNDEVVAAPARSPHLARLRPTSGEVAVMELPRPRRFADPECPDRTLERRVSGDPDFLADGRLLVPLLFADTDLRVPAFADPDGDGLPGFDTATGVDLEEPLPDEGLFCAEERPRPGGGAYGTPARVDRPGDKGRFTPALGEVDLGRLVVDELHVLALVHTAHATTDNATGDVDLRATVARSYAGAVRVDADGRTAWVTFPGSALGAVVDVDADSREELEGFHSPARTGFDLWPGVDGVAPRADGDGVVFSSTPQRMVVALAGAQQPSIDPRNAMDFDLDVTGSAELPASSLPASVQAGRALFLSATSPGMSAASSGVSCETCHAEGRNDGFTWIFEDMPRQTPSLAGPVADTAPFTWLGDVPTIEAEVHATTEQRMGGSGITGIEARNVAAYVAWTRAPIRPPADADAIARGRAVFESPTVGCVECHAGDAYTDGKAWDVLGFETETNTPSLRGVGSTAPYLHDGSAPTLRDVLLRAGNGAMGLTRHLTDEELDDLETFLRSL